MKRVIFLVLFMVILIALLLFGLRGTVISIADNEVARSMTETDSSSASAIIPTT